MLHAAARAIGGGAGGVGGGQRRADAEPIGSQLRRATTSTRVASGASCRRRGTGSRARDPGPLRGRARASRRCTAGSRSSPTRRASWPRSSGRSTWWRRCTPRSSAGCRPGRSIGPADENPDGWTYVQNRTFFWVDEGPGQWDVVSGSTSAGGISVTVQAVPERLVVDPGDGSEAVVCDGAPPAVTKATYRPDIEGCSQSTATPRRRRRTARPSRSSPRSCGTRRGRPRRARAATSATCPRRRRPAPGGR